MNLRKVIEDLLPLVEKPSRYLGTEWNTVHKDPAAVQLRLCLFFPDLYELGLGNLGLHILYAILNGMDKVWAERAYTPAPDMESLLRERGLPLFMHESRDPVGAADAVGFSLQSELTFVNVLNVIDLAGFPVRSADRADDVPLFFAGGPAAYNPEPLAPFLDFIVIGDGEEVVVDIANALLPLRGAPRRTRLEAVSRIPGVYVPALHPVETVNGVPMADAMVRVTRRVARDLDATPFPARPIVPFTQLVHDGAGIEVLRGCTQGCRFCHAGMANRPVRERTVETVGGLLNAALDSSGLDAATLVSLSTCDHSRAVALVSHAAAMAHPRGVSVSLPSLRLDSFSVELADLVSGVRRSGLTFAPEAATPRLRAVINKAIPDEELIGMAEEAFRRGWEHVKTYFMIGLPTERDEDVQAIADLCLRTLEAGRRLRRSAMVRAGVSTFVPKAHTPFQWARQLSIEETVAKQRMLADTFRPNRGIKFGRHNPAASFIEGLVSRGDRRAADLIEQAWRLGAGFETWDEKLDITPWMKAIEKTGFDAEAALRERVPGERLPWDHIDTLVDRDWLIDEWHRAQALETARDCRQGRCNLCGVNRTDPKGCGEMQRRSAEGRAEKAAAEAVMDRIPLATPQAEPVQRVRFRIGRTGVTRFLSHLETAEAWIRGLRRAHAPLAFSQGFHAHAKVTFATAAPLGEECKGDWMDVMLAGHVSPAALCARLAVCIPQGLHAYEAFEVPLRCDSLMASVVGFDYELHAPGDPGALAARAMGILSATEVLLDRTVKSRSSEGGRKKISLDLRPLISELSVTDLDEEGNVVVRFATRMSEDRLAKPKEIVALLGLDPARTRVVRTETLLKPVVSGGSTG
jgi:radical SAM family uncharacterized protein/radical SAM-linked protein